MRLLNVYTLEFKIFLTEEERPPYVITSHRWVEKLTYQQFLNHAEDASIRTTAGFQKVQSFCNFVKTWNKDADLIWIWIDTCCIDKTSSAELGEALNSMFRWYANAHVCLAYLNDVGSLDADPADLMKDFQDSVWFRRGWTLQELLAPQLVVFLNQDWEVFGHKAPARTQKQVAWNWKTLRPFSAREIRLPLNFWISKTTGISEDIISDYAKSSALDVAEKRSWMTGRKTTRIEDAAYCLLGICGVYLPLIYGEREQAFERLEEAIERRYLKTATASIPASTPRSPSPAPSFSTDSDAETMNDDAMSEATVDWREVADGHKAKGNELYKAKRYSAAIEEYTKAIELCPQVSVYFANRAAVYITTRRYDDALRDCLKAKELDPDNLKINERLRKVQRALEQANEDAPLPSPHSMSDFRIPLSRSETMPQIHATRADANDDQTTTPEAYRTEIRGPAAPRTATPQRPQNSRKPADTKACPQCRLLIQQNGGSDHMTCSKCRHEFCWQREAQDGQGDERTRKMNAHFDDARDYIATPLGRRKAETKSTNVVYRERIPPQQHYRKQASSRTSMRSSEEDEPRDRRPPTLNTSKSSPADIEVPVGNPRAASIQADVDEARPVPQLRRSETMPYKSPRTP